MSWRDWLIAVLCAGSLFIFSAWALVTAVLAEPMPPATVTVTNYRTETGAWAIDGLPAPVEWVSPGGCTYRCSWRVRSWTSTPTGNVGEAVRELDLIGCGVGEM